LKTEFKSITGTEWKPSVQVQVKTPTPNIRDKLLFRISEQGNKVRQLKSQKAAKNIIDSEVKVLLALKSEFKAATGEEWQPGLQPAIASAESEELPAEQLSSKITEQGDIVRKLKSEKAAKEILDAEVKTLLALKAEYKSVTGIEWKPVPRTEEPVVAMAEQDRKPGDSEIAALTQKITDQGNVVRQLKTSGADKVSTLLILCIHLYYFT
jgi:bifunctional glutamyl/prolyl-tRNA synthetase